MGRRIILNIYTLYIISNVNFKIICRSQKSYILFLYNYNQDQLESIENLVHSNLNNWIMLHKLHEVLFFECFIFILYLTWLLMSSHTNINQIALPLILFHSLFMPHTY